MTVRSNSLFAAIHAKEFPAQAILRLRPDLQTQPVAILDGAAPLERVCAMNTLARKRGVDANMPRLEVEEMTGICILTRSINTELAAKAVLLECISQFSPRIEDSITRSGCGFVLDISGSERLFGLPHILAQRMHSEIMSAGFRTSLTISRNFDCARMVAENSQSTTVIDEAHEASHLASIPIASLQLDEEYYDTFSLWGIRTLGSLAELPEEDSISRFGQQSQRWIRLARGNAEHTFQPIERAFELKEHIEFDTHVEQVDSLLFICANMINNLSTRATSRALSLASLRVQMSLERELAYERTIRPAIASNDQKFLLKLLQLEISAHPPKAAIISLTLTAEPGKQSNVQLGLFAPQTPESSRLDITLARLKSLVGEDRVGSPALIDSHQGGSFKMEQFAINNQPSIQTDAAVRMSLRRIRPPHLLCMQSHAARPVRFNDGDDCYEVQAVYGPWYSSGCWWAGHSWDVEEWDIMALNNMGENIRCLIYYDKLQSKWLLNSIYD